jgi:thiosulfate dehydrogenase (quinone) large subunit
VKQTRQIGPLALLSRCVAAQVRGETWRPQVFEKDVVPMVVSTHFAPEGSVADNRVGSSPVIQGSGSSVPESLPEASSTHPTGAVALIGLRLTLGFLFLWAFIDKMFGLGYSTPSAHAWIRGGSPTKGFLSGANVGPLQGFFRDIAGAPGMDWLFMIGLLGIGLALILGVALRPAAASGALLVMLMWFATWPPATMGGGQPTGSTNPVVDEHVLEAFTLVVVAAYAGKTAGYLGRWWADLDLVKKYPWLR